MKLKFTAMRRLLMTLSALLLAGCIGAGNADAELTIERSTIAEGDAQWDWTQARTAMVPLEQPYFLTTMSRTAKVGTHGYHDVYVAFSADAGQSWSAPQRIDTLTRRRQDDGFEVVPGDLYPIWHAASETVLITGKTFNFAAGTKEDYLREKVAYCVFDPRARRFGPLQILDMPDQDHGGDSFIAANAGCHQPFILPEGDVWLPIRYQKHRSPRNYTSIVARCQFDGHHLRYREHGSELSIPTHRGLYEPSVTYHEDTFYVTLRADDGAYVSKSRDGIHYGRPIPWKFTDGELLGSYNTQQHWITLGGKLYLLYTRRGAANDHIMRHRAPLFVAEVDGDRLVVIRETEQVVVPENDATLGNSGVCRINDRESWVTVAEGRVSHGRRRGENNRVLLAKLRAAGGQTTP